MLRAITAAIPGFKKPAAPLVPMHLVRKAHQHGHKLTIGQNKTAFVVLAAGHHRNGREGDVDHLTWTSGIPRADQPVSAPQSPTPLPCSTFCSAPPSPGLFSVAFDLLVHVQVVGVELGHLLEALPIVD